MSNSDEFIEIKQSGSVAESQAKHSLMLFNELNQVITNIFKIANKYGSSFSFNENKHFVDKTDLGNNVFLLQEKCQDIDNMQNQTDDSHIVLNILPIISRTDIGRFQNFSSQLDDFIPKWYVEFNETKSLLSFVSAWHKKELTLSEDAETDGINNLNYQYKDLLIAYAKWQYFAPIADYLNQAMTHKIIAHYSGDYELNVKEDQYTANIINNAITNGINILPVISSLDVAIAQHLFDDSEPSILLDFKKNIVYLNGVKINSIYTADPPLILQNYTAIADAMAKDCNSTLSNTDQTSNLIDIDCILNWEPY